MTTLREGPRALARLWHCERRVAVLVVLGVLLGAVPQLIRWAIE